MSHIYTIGGGKGGVGKSFITANLGVLCAKLGHRVLLVDLDLANLDDNISKVQSIHRINNFALGQLSDAGNVVLILDEAQNLNLHAIENLRLLSNLETPKHKLIQIVLSGQPELEAKLDQSELRQLAQRISLRRHIHPLKKTETYDYVRHRLTVAGYKGAELFSRGALNQIWRYSGGIPRMINILSDNVLLIGFRRGINQIRRAMVNEAVNDLKWKPVVHNSGTYTQKSHEISAF